MTTTDHITTITEVLAAYGATPVYYRRIIATGEGFVVLARKARGFVVAHVDVLGRELTVLDEGETKPEGGAAGHAFEDAIATARLDAAGL